MLGRCTLPMNATGSQGQQFFGCGVVHYERRQDKILAGEEAADFCFTPASYGEDAKIGTILSMDVRNLAVPSAALRGVSFHFVLNG
jgi:hypothetical protein